jgi:peptide/nickel transport system substrate-binding protein
LLLAGLTACKPAPHDPGTVVVIIESSPNSLDPRIGTDAQSERIDGLIFDALVKKDAHFELRPWLATRWEQPDPLHWIFHLRPGVRFQDGRPLQAADVAWTIASMTDGTLSTAKGGNLASVKRAVAVDPLTLEVELKRPDETLLFNLSDGMFGVVPRGSGPDFGQTPVGSGAFRFISAAQDKEVVLARMPSYWAQTQPADPRQILRLRFAVVPDAVTSALELKKGSADVAVNVVTLDMVHVLERTPGLEDATGPGSPVMYLNFNCAHGALRDVRVRQAIALALDRHEIIEALWRGRARLADGLLPPGHWAAAMPDQVAHYPHDPAQARHLLQAAGYPADANGVRLRLEMKTSTDETTRLLAVILQQQLRAAGIELTLRSAEFGTFYADVTRGAFEMYALRWIGANEDPDIYRYAFASADFPPNGGNRGHYSNPAVDRLLADAARVADPAARRRDYVAVQQILARELPAIPLWFPDNNIVHTARIHGIVPSPDGSFDFLKEASVDGN